jgi:hypothetical protein
VHRRTRRRLFAHPAAPFGIGNAGGAVGV